MPTDKQRHAIRKAAEQAYDKLRWIVGDSEELMAEMQILARDSYVEGMKQANTTDKGNSYGNDE